MDSSSVFFSAKKQKSPDGIVLNFVRGVERKTVGGVVALLVSFRGDLEREETGGGTGWQSGGNAGNPNFIDGLDEARCK